MSDRKINKQELPDNTNPGFSSQKSWKDQEKNKKKKESDDLDSHGRHIEDNPSDNL